MKEMTTFTEGTNELYLRPVPPELVGWNFFDAAQLFTHSVVCGVKAGDGPPRLMPQAKRELQEGDRLLVLARCQGDADVWLRQDVSKPPPSFGVSETLAPEQFRRSESAHLTRVSLTSTAD